MDYRLICFDMDGTLLNSRKEITDESVAAIGEAVRQGKTVALSTGRSLPELTYLYDRLRDVRYFICISGAVIFDKAEGRAVFEHMIPADEAYRLLRFAKTRDVMIHIHSFESVVEKSKLAVMEQYQMSHNRSLFSKTVTAVDDVLDFYSAHPDAMAKINLYHRSVAAREETLRMITAEGFDLELAFSEATSLECSAKGVSKGTGLVRLCGHLGIPVAQSIAVGDADNDLEILKTCGLAVAMGNANVRVKEIADVVVADNDSGGCAQAVYEHLLA